MASPPSLTLQPRPVSVIGPWFFSGIWLLEFGDFPSLRSLRSFAASHPQLDGFARHQLPREQPLRFLRHPDPAEPRVDQEKLAGIADQLPVIIGEGGVPQGDGRV